MAHSGRPLRIAVIGAGASGVMAVIKLREAGYDDVVVFEKADDLGGTWRDNRYPGLTCDVESHAYRYSFAPNPDWSATCSPGPEIQAYLKRVARDHGVEAHIRFGHEVVAARFEQDRWAITTNRGPQGAFDVVITATGVLHHPALPDIAGLKTFAGPCFHSSAWPDGLDLTGKRVGVVGTGSTATQIVKAITPQVAALTLFQRTAQWVLPLPNPPISEDRKAEFRDDPALLESEYNRLNLGMVVKFADALVGENPHTYQRIVDICAAHLDTIGDPELKLKMTPDHRPGCKRMVMAEGFYEALQQPNAGLVTEAIAGVEPGGVRTADGVLHGLDVLVLATGFNTHRFFRPMAVTGPDGTTLAQAWADKNEGYKCVATPGFPNWFMIGGPNSPIGNYSWLLTAERQFGFIKQLIDLIASGAARRIAPTRAATAAFNAALQQKIPDTIWATGCKSWYIDSKGRIASWPWTFAKFESDMSAPVLQDFELG